MSRRILTQSSIDELIDAGNTEIALAPGDIVTALAREYAESRGVRLYEAGGPAEPAAPAPSPSAAPAGQQVDAAAVRKAVINALGHTPDGLDAIIARVLK